MTAEQLTSTLRALADDLARDSHLEAAKRQVDDILLSGQLSLPAIRRLGTVLAEVGRVLDAERLYKQLIDTFPNHAQGFVGMAELAMRKGNWQEGLTRWNELSERFPQAPNASWLCGSATSLLELGRHDEAEKVFRKLTLGFENEPFGLAGLARLAMSRQRWDMALELWDQVFAQFPERVHPGWHFFRAQALAQVARTGEAEEECRGLVRSNPDCAAGWTGLLGVLGAQGKWEEAKNVLESAPDAMHKVPGLIASRFNILLGLGRFDEARNEFRRLLQEGVDAQNLLELFRFAPILYNGWERTSALLSLLYQSNLDRSKNSESSAEETRANMHGLRARIFLALRDYSQFLSIVAGAAESDLGEHGQQLLAIAARLRESSFPNYDAPKVFGVGLSRTGTSSLTAALAALNFRAIHWLNPLTNEMMGPDDLHLFDAFTDTPVCTNFENYYFMFRNSKFVYTVRPFESWQKSMRDYFRKRLGTGEFRQLRELMNLSGQLPHGTDFSNIHLALYFNYESYEAAYRSYDARVRRFFRDKPKDRFLEFDVSSGNWEELCAFTERRVPPIDFPWLNRSER